MRQEHQAIFLRQARELLASREGVRPLEARIELLEGMVAALAELAVETALMASHDSEQITRTLVTVQGFFATSCTETIQRQTGGKPYSLEVH